MLESWNNGPTKSAIVDFVGRIDGAGEVPVGLAEDLGGFVAVHPLGARSPVQDPAFEIGGDDGFPHAGEQLRMQAQGFVGAFQRPGRRRLRRGVLG